MDEQTIEQKLEDQDKKLSAIFVSVEKTRKYILVVVWITVIMFLLPLIGLLFIVPTFIQTYLGIFGGAF